MKQKTILLLTLVFLFSSLGSPAMAKILVEPAPAELPTDGVNIDDERFVPIWHLSPVQLATYFILIYCPVLALPAEIFYSAGLWAVLGYRRVSRQRDPVNDNRQEIFACIREHPGAGLIDIETETGISRSTVRYHLGCMEQRGLIHRLKTGGTVGYFRNTADRDRTEEQVLIHLKNETRECLISLLMKRPGSSQSEGAEAAGISGPTVSWHMKRLISDGIVRSRKDRHMLRYWLTPEAGRILRNMEIQDSRTITGQHPCAAPQTD